MKKQLTQKELHKILDYNPNTGIFTWKVGQKKGNKAGTFWGKLGPTIMYKRITYQMKRLAWIYVHGKIPNNMLVIFKNKNNMDLSINNLELTTPQLCSLYRKEPKNIEYRKDSDKYLVYLTIYGKKIGRKYFDKLEDAEKYSKKLKQSTINAIKNIDKIK